MSVLKVLGKTMYVTDDLKIYAFEEDCGIDTTEGIYVNYCQVVGSVLIQDAELGDFDVNIDKVYAPLQAGTKDDSIILGHIDVTNCITKKFKESITQRMIEEALNANI